VQAIVGNGDGVLRPTGTHEIRDAAVTAVCAFLPLRRRVAESSTAALYALSWVGSASSSWQECGGEEWEGRCVRGAHGHPRRGVFRRNFPADSRGTLAVLQIPLSSQISSVGVSSGTL
jgi:hypothetical protein